MLLHSSAVLAGMGQCTWCDGMSDATSSTRASAICAGSATLTRLSTNPA